MRSQPHFIIIGTMKGGTTSLYSNMGNHPEIIISQHKELHYFDKFYHKGTKWYKAYFPSPLEVKPLSAQINNGRWITCEATPNYLFAPYVAARVAQHLPEVKLIVMLRDPVARAFSHYFMRARGGKFENDETGAELREELNFLRRYEIDRAHYERFAYNSIAAFQYDWAYPKDQYQIAHADDCEPYRGSTYLLRGMYYEQLKIWFEHFPREQFLIIKSKDYFTDPEHFIEEKVPTFLGVPTWKMPVYVQSKQEAHAPSKIDPGLQDELAQFFKPYNQKLYDLLGVDFNWYTGMR